MLESLKNYLYSKPEETDSSVENYWEILKVSENNKLNFKVIKESFRKLMVENSKVRTTRIKLNQAYSEATSKIFQKKTHPLVNFINNGDNKNVKNYLIEKKILNEKIGQYPPIYYAVRAGHYDVVKFLLKAGCSLSFQKDKSTPMHCAAFYGHHSLIPLLLEYGLPTDIKNFSENLPVQESATTEIKILLKNAQLNKINELNEKILKEEIGYSMINIKVQGKIILKKIILKNYFSKFTEHIDAFHGTKYDALFSIAMNGLRKPGQVVQGKKIGVVDGHIPLGRQVRGIDDWSNAVFVSPSIYYSANPVYAKEVIVNGKQTWIPVVHVKVKKGAYTEHDHTLPFYSFKKNQPKGIQYRAEPTDLQFPVDCPGQNLIIRSGDSSNITVVSLIFIRKGFLDQSWNYNETMQLILNSHEERKFREQGKC